MGSTLGASFADSFIVASRTTWGDGSVVEGVGWAGEKASLHKPVHRIRQDEGSGVKGTRPHAHSLAGFCLTDIFGMCKS
jgi:hypothetical protein